MVRQVAILSLVLIGSACLSAPAQTMAPDVLKKLDDLADQVKTSLDTGDLARANRLASDLMLGIFNQRKAVQPTPQQKLAALDQDAADPQQRQYLLPRLAVAAFENGHLDQAEAYAREALATAGDPKNWNYGNSLFFGNMIIGRVALARDKDIEQAKASLLAAARTPGSPQLNSFGPNMSLAKDLIAAGERDLVLEYFQLCRSFWKMGQDKLDAWTAMVKGGGMPDFGANLLYD